MKKVPFLFALVLCVVLLTVFEAGAQDSGDSGIICDNEYALCTSAPCVPDPSSPDSKAICRCEYNKGKNYGMSECSARTPVVDSNGVTKVLSTYSFAQASSKPVLSCPTGKPWTDCLDMPCVVDQANPLQAICTCEIVRDKAFMTYGGDCNSLTCDNAYWSAATAEDFNEGTVMLVQEMGLKESPVRFCAGMEPDAK